MDYINLSKSLLGVEGPYYSSDEKGASVEFLVVADDNTYEEFAKRTPLLEESVYDSFEDLMRSDDYMNIYVNVRENGTVEAVIGTSGGGELYSVALSSKEQEALRTFIYAYCNVYMDKSLAEMFEEAREHGSPVNKALEDIYGNKDVAAVANKSPTTGSRCSCSEGTARMLCNREQQETGCLRPEATGGKEFVDSLGTDASNHGEYKERIKDRDYER